MADKFDEMAAERLPCICASDMHALDNPCPHYYRPAIAALLREVDAKAYVRGLERAHSEAKERGWYDSNCYPCSDVLQSLIDAAKAG